MQLTDALLDLCKTSKTPIIAIDGRAGAGKTTLASDLAVVLSPRYSIKIVHMDDLYPGWDDSLGAHLRDSLVALVDSHIKGEGYTISHFNWASNQFHSPMKFEKVDLLILEGVGSGQSAIRSNISALIWMEIDANQGLSRVIDRDGSSVAPHMDSWLLQQEQHFRSEDTYNRADFILTT